MNPRIALGLAMVFAPGVASAGDCDVVLTAVGGHKVNVVTAIKQGAGISLAAANAMTTDTPTPVVTGVSVAKANSVAAALQDAGASVTNSCAGKSADEEVPPSGPALPAGPCVVTVYAVGNRVNLTRALKRTTGLRLKTCNELAGQAPGPVLQGVSKTLAAAATAAIVETGAEVSNSCAAAPATPAPQQPVRGGGAIPAGPCDVSLTAVGGARLSVVKAVKSATGLSLRSAKALVDAAPGPILLGVGQAVASAAASGIGDAGATVTNSCAP